MTPLHHIQRTHISPVLGQGSREGSAWCSRCLLQKKRLTAQGGGTRSGRASADRGTSAERPGGKASLDQTACCLKPPGWPALSPPPHGACFTCSTAKLLFLGVLRLNFTVIERFSLCSHSRGFALNAGSLDTGASGKVHLVGAEILGVAVADASVFFGGCARCRTAIPCPGHLQSCSSSQHFGPACHVT